MNFNSRLFLENESGIRKLIEKGLGETMVIDRFSSEPDIINRMAEFVSYVKIGWGLPFLFPEQYIGERVGRYRSMGVGISNGGTLLEKCYVNNKLENCLNAIHRMGFNVLEVSEGITDIPMRVKRQTEAFARNSGMRFIVEIGKKNRNNQLSLNETTKKIEEALTLEPDLIIIEGRETGIGVEIYDGEGNIKWDWVEEIMDSCPRNRLLFEAPMEKQQTELILHLGNDINLGNVSVESVAAVASERLGFRGDTFGIQSSVKNFSGSPSAKFVYHVIKNAISSDQAMIIQITGLSRRTIQNALDELLKSGKIREHADPSDLRRKIYSVIQ